jgi:thiaminase
MDFSGAFPSFDSYCKTTCRKTTCRETTCRETTCRETTCRETTCRETTCRETTCREFTTYMNDLQIMEGVNELIPIFITKESNYIRIMPQNFEGSKFLKHFPPLPITSHQENPYNL